MANPGSIARRAFRKGIHSIAWGFVALFPAPARSEGKGLLHDVLFESFAQCEKAPRTLTYEGTIDPRISFHLKSACDRGQRYLRLYYDQYGVEIPVSFEWPRGDLAELNPQGQVTGVFNFLSSTTGEARGVWSKPDGSEQRPFVLKPSLSYDSLLKKPLGTFAVPDPTEIAVSTSVRSALCGTEPTCFVLDARRVEGESRSAIITGQKKQGEADISTYDLWLLDPSLAKGKQLLGRFPNLPYFYFFNESREFVPHPMGKFVTIGQNKISVNDNYPRRITVETAWVNLDPPRMSSQSFYHNLPAGGPNVFPPFFEMTWDWETFRGNGKHHYVDPCQAKGLSREEPAFLMIPRVDMPADFLKEGWRTTILGSASLSLGSGESPGFLLTGTRDSTTTVVRLLLASDRDLLVDIPGTHFFAHPSNWISSDHLEIWQIDPNGPDAYPEFDLGPRSAEPKTYQWGISLAELKIFPAFGKPTRWPKVERAVKGAGGQEWTGLKITLPYPVRKDRGLTVSFSQSRNGEKVDYLLSSSDLCFGNPQTFSFVWPIDPKIAIPQFREGFLDLSSVPGSPNFPIIVPITEDWDPDY